MNILDYVYFAILALTLIANVLSLFMAKHFKKINKKVPTALNNMLKLFNEVIPEAIKFAETSGNVNGATKKTVALSKIMLECTKLGISYSDNAEKIDKAIEDLIGLTKEVNRVNVIKEVSE